MAANVTPYRIVCEGWRRVGGGAVGGDGVNDYDAWYYLDHVGAFRGRAKTFTSADMVFASEQEARHWAEAAAADSAADHNGIVPVLAIEPVES